jgi:hypothetical protein
VRRETTLTQVKEFLVATVKLSFFGEDMPHC